MMSAFFQFQHTCFSIIVNCLTIVYSHIDIRLEGQIDPPLRKNYPQKLQSY